MSTSTAYFPGSKWRNRWTGIIAEVVCRNPNNEVVLVFPDKHRIARDDASMEQNWVQVIENK